MLKLNRKYKHGQVGTKGYKEGTVVTIAGNNCILEITKGYGWGGNPNNLKQHSAREYWNVFLKDDSWFELPIKNIVGGKLL